MSAPDARIAAPAAARNRDPILEVLRPLLPGEGRVLEVASGSGEHVAHFAAALPRVRFQPSDPGEAARASIDAWVRDLPNVARALALDAAGDWPDGPFDGVICINMIHISPWAATEGLFAGAARVLAPGGFVLTYGPYRRGGRHTAPSNAEFDASLQARNAQWAVRDLEAVAAVAAHNGFRAPDVTQMPANNLALVFRRD